MICLGNIIPVSIYVCWAATVDVYGSSDARRLYHNLMEKYNANNNKLIRPVLDNTGILNVSMGLKFTQLIGVVRELFSGSSPQDVRHICGLLVHAYNSAIKTTVTRYLTVFLDYNVFNTSQTCGNRP